MTATAVPQGVSARSWNTLLKVAMLAIVLIVLLAGSFAFGRSTAADASSSGARATPSPAVNAGNPATSASLDMPPVSLHTGVVHAYVEPDPESCGHTAHTAPC